MRPETRKAAAYIDRLDPETRTYLLGMVYRVGASNIARFSVDRDPHLSVVGAPSQDQRDPEDAAPEADPIGTAIPFPGPVRS